MVFQIEKVEPTINQGYRINNSISFISKNTNVIQLQFSFLEANTLKLILVHAQEYSYHINQSAPNGVQSIILQANRLYFTINNGVQVQLGQRQIHQLCKVFKDIYG